MIVFVWYPGLNGGVLKEQLCGTWFKKLFFLCYMIMIREINIKYFKGQKSNYIKLSNESFQKSVNLTYFHEHIIFDHDILMLISSIPDHYLIQTRNFVLKLIFITNQNAYLKTSIALLSVSNAMLKFLVNSSEFQFKLCIFYSTDFDITIRF